MTPHVPTKTIISKSSWQGSAEIRVAESSAGDTVFLSLDVHATGAGTASASAWLTPSAASELIASLAHAINEIHDPAVQ